LPRSITSTGTSVLNMPRVITIKSAPPTCSRASGDATLRKPVSLDSGRGIKEREMAELEMKDEADTEEFTDELSDEALDREADGDERIFVCGPMLCNSRWPER
jgi:hypothetical protein